MVMTAIVESSGVVEKKSRSVEVSVRVAKLINKKKKKKSSNRLVQKGHLQMLFDACKYVFKGPGTVPPPEDVKILCHILDAMKPEDVGLSRDLQFYRSKSEAEGTPRVTSSTIYKCENFELSIFFLPAGTVIPLHNHPEMTVFSKLLLGTMHIKAYDWVDPHHSIESHSQLRLAKLKANRNFTAPCDTSVLYPTSGGNIHEFQSVTPCVVLDVIGPPYSKDDGRDCSYYRETPFLGKDKEGLLEFEDDDDGDYRWLEEIEVPQESEMDGIEYRGPQIIDST